jgi:2-polyprenyl-3-methyl-5-hydroxy-6-metoxy-1,4-benzoquinol methylase
MWNHNIHYHSYLLRQIPIKVNRVLDVGCGLGLFAWKLAERAEVVDALDVDSAILAEASNYNPAPNITCQQADFLKSALPEAAYDVIVSIATLHHMDMEAALQKMKLLLRPSGKLLILGRNYSARVLSAGSVLGVMCCLEVFMFKTPDASSRYLSLCSKI